MRKKLLGCVVIVLLLAGGCARKEEAYSKSERTYDFDYLTTKIENLHPSLLCLKEYEGRKDAFYKRALAADGDDFGSILKEYLSPYIEAGIRCLLDTAALEELCKKYTADKLMELHVLDNDAAKKRYGDSLQKMEKYHKKREESKEKNEPERSLDALSDEKDEGLRQQLAQQGKSAVIALPESGYLVMIRPDDKTECE